MPRQDKRRKWSVRAVSALDIERQLINYACGIVGLRRTDGGQDMPPDGWVVNNLILDGRCGYLTANDDSAGFYVIDGSSEKGGDAEGPIKRYDVPRYVFAKPSRFGQQTPFLINTDRMHLIRANARCYPPVLSIRRYATMIAQCYTALSVNLKASTKGQLVLANRNQKDAIEDYLNDLYEGQAYGVFDISAADDLQLHDISAPFLGREIHDLLRSLEGDARREIGGLTKDQYKSERVQSAEVDAAIGESLDFIHQLIDTANADLKACGAPYEFYNRGYSAAYDMREPDAEECDETDDTEDEENDDE